MAIRCTDLERMGAFYGDVLGLERLQGNHRAGIVFFRIAPGVAGHTAVLALFHEPVAAGPPRSRLHHLALGMTRSDQEAAIAWFAAEGVAYRLQSFDWIGWRGVFVDDPEGNTVELVAYDDTWRSG
ncbi:MAG: VOC family protein [Pseudomonadota bacterium]